MALPSAATGPKVRQEYWIERRHDWKDRAAKAELVPASFTHSADPGRGGCVHAHRWRLLAECSAPFLVAHLACFPDFARLFLVAPERPQRSRFDGGTFRPSRQVSCPHSGCLSLFGRARWREGSRRTPLRGGPRLRRSPALRPL